MSSRQRLFKEFPPAGTKEWTERIAADLKGEDLMKKLTWKTKEGFDILPFYRREDIEDIPFTCTRPGKAPFVRGQGNKRNSWYIRQDIIVEDYSQSNSKALDIIAKGVDSLGFILKYPQTVNADNLERLCKGIPLDYIELNLISDANASEILTLLKRILEVNGIDRDKVRGSLEPYVTGSLMNREWSFAYGNQADYLAGLTVDSATIPGFRTVHINTGGFSGPDTDIVTELAFGLSLGNGYLYTLTDRSVPAGLAASKIKFTFHTGPNYFFEIAKLRAARLLWSYITGRYQQGDNTGSCMEIHSITGRWDHTVSDPHINLLRTQTKAMSAILGGTDSLTVEPFDIVFRSPDEFSERIARNQQLLLRHESCFDRVIDPAGGSYYIEKLTNLIAAHSWKLFIEMEERGGFFESLNQGFIQEKMERSHRQQEHGGDKTRRKEWYETSVQA
jgi:methylmalonyl-CoA mutase